jgi:hypothetical protein
VEGEVASNAKKTKSGPVVSTKRYDFYPWSSNNMLFKRGTALIFSQANCQMAKDFEVALKHLEFCPILLDLSKAVATLGNSKFLRVSLAVNYNTNLIVSRSGLMSNEGSLFVVMIAPIEGVEEKSSTGLTVTLVGGIRVPIGYLTKNFITSKCASFAEKPKVFYFIDPGVATNHMATGIPVRKFFNFLLLIYFNWVNSSIVKSNAFDVRFRLFSQN